MAPCSLNSRTGKDKVIDMKKIGIVIMLLMASWCANAQDCSVLVLPYFGNNSEDMAKCPADKFQIYCMIARNAFYVSDTVPTDAEMYSINAVKDNFNSNFLPENFEVDLNTLSYFGYNFNLFQLSDPNKTICFSTPGSTHPYLVLRSYYEMMDIDMNKVGKVQTR